MTYKRGDVWWYKFRWRTDGEPYIVRRSAHTRSRREAEAAERAHREALRLGDVHPLDEWPKPEAPKNAEQLPYANLRDALLSDYRVNRRKSLQRLEDGRETIWWLGVLDRFFANSRLRDITVDRVRTFVE